MPDSFVVVLTTLPTRAKAREISKLLIQKKLVACVNLLGPAQSFFHWQGKLNQTQEYLLVLKTTARCFSRVRTFLEQNHPYQVPEIISLPIKKGNAPYLNWIRTSVRPD